MQCSPDWTQTLRRASFRGVPFFVEHDDIAYGRRIKTHEFPNRDRPLQEDLGEKAVDYKVTAYLASDNVLADKDALVSACRRRGVGSLSLPTERPQRVVCFECRRSHAKDKLGYIAFDLHFGEEGETLGVSTTALLQRLISVVGGNAISAIGAEFEQAFNTIGDIAAVVDAATGTVHSWLSFVDGLRLEVPMLGIGSSTGASIYASIGRLSADARTLAYSGSGISYGSPGSIGSSPVATPSLLPARVADMVGELRLACSSGADAVTILTALASYDVKTFVDAPLPGEVAAIDYVPLCPTAAAEARNEAAIGHLFRRTALVELAIAAGEISYGDRRSAIKARADVVELFAREMQTARGMTFAALDRVRGQCASAISASIADTRATIVIEGIVTRPSLAWAQKLYGGAARASELARRNHVRHPAFMPAEFEAEAP
jgi:prophage DNA circulation protein